RDWYNRGSMTSLGASWRAARQRKLAATRWRMAHPVADEQEEERQRMAYRFILEVPESLVGDANVVINTTGDAQAHFVRDSHGLGFEDPYKDFPISAHSLRIIDAIYAWYADMGANDPAMRLNV